ncbi:hypothetical protein ACSLVK_07605 [Photorhabdus tasmaniensis]|uniref:Uncharacterized protein n=1 Tax=Photorhabdus tasmaniensis TaxID=1004159 RepID=A0ABX0GPY6_9GAMM|nr:hypothetical protein [Photorhabdus tasmaniensis]NHB90390.1 hypothetical protein [Photorhabdus tasmaniensis]
MFDGSPVIASVSATYITKNTDRFEVSDLTLKNGGNILKIIPEGLYYLGVKGCLEVTIHNPSSASSTSKFNLHWKDRISKLPGWVIVLSGVGNAPAQRIEFNQENFFKMIMEFTR